LKKRTLILLSYILVAALASFVTLFTANALSNNESSKLDQLSSIIEERFIGEADMTKLEDAAAAAMIAASGDRWSYYIPASEYLDYQERSENAYVGVGITIQPTQEDAGFLILRREYTKEPQLPSSDLSVITPECRSYWFYLPELAELTYKAARNGLYYPDYGFNPLGLAMMEAGFSRHSSDRARIYVMTGFYDENDQWIARSERMTKAYLKIERKVRKLAERVV